MSTVRAGGLNIHGTIQFLREVSDADQSLRRRIDTILSVLQRNLRNEIDGHCDATSDPKRGLTTCVKSEEIRSTKRIQKEAKVVFLSPESRAYQSDVVSKRLSHLLRPNEFEAVVLPLYNRRHSADAIHLQSNYDRRVRQSRLSLVHRKSTCEETFAQALLQAQSLSEMEDDMMSTSDKSLGQSPRADWRWKLYRSWKSEQLTRSNSAGTAAQPYQSSLHSLGSVVVRFWPSTITSRLTNGQPLQDRLALFWAIEDVFMGRHKNSFACRPRKQKGLQMASGTWSIARPDKPNGGEDAFFCCGLGFVGIADGVGEWREWGCDARQFADELIEGAHREVSRIVRKDLHSQNQNHGNNIKECIASTSRRSKGLPIQGCSCSVCDSCSDVSPAIQLRLASGIETRQSQPSHYSLAVLKAGFANARSFGSSTALIAGIDEDGKTLGVANLGDSALIVLRRITRRYRQMTICQRTREQQHYFNCPYQLSRIPAQEDAEWLKERGMHKLIKVLSGLKSGYKADHTEMADLYDIGLQEGDLVLMATDGVFDNLFDHEIASLVSLAFSPYDAYILDMLGVERGRFDFAFITPPERDDVFGLATPPQAVARALAEAAFFRSLDCRASTPFARQSKRGGAPFQGGKMDDITVVAFWAV